MLCAVSGGLDSMCLLDFMDHLGHKHGRRFLRRRRPLQSPASGAQAADRDEAVCPGNWCAAREHSLLRRLGAMSGACAERDRASPLEEAARQLRYAFLEETAGGGRALTPF